MHKSIIRRISKIEQHSLQPRWRVVVKDYDGLYRGECGDGLTQSQFDNWTKQQDKDTQVIIVEVSSYDSTNSESETTNFKVENLADKNVSDFLKGYDELIQISRSAETGITAKSVEAQVLEVDTNCGCFTGEQAKVIAQAQEIIRNAPIH
jgi:hypothetical protein